jgi:transposase
MSDARPYGLTNHDVRRMREMRADGCTMSAIAAIVGVSTATVYKYAGDVEKGGEKPEPRSAPGADMRARAVRYAAFVARASAYVSVIGASA